MMRIREGAAWAGAVFPAIVVIAAYVVRGTMFWGDLIFIHFGWRAFVAQAVQAGQLPLWNPTIYLGMPMAAQMQSSVWFPASLPFYLFGFETGLALFHAVVYVLAPAFTFLWLRSWGASRWAAASGAAAYSLCGVMASRFVFFNHAATLALVPAMLLFARRPPLLGLTLALGFAAGYPPVLCGGAACAFLFATARAVYLRSGRSGAASAAFGIVRKWMFASVFALGLSSLLLLPAVELTSDSKRSSGVEQGEKMTWAFTPGDFIQLTAPPLVPEEEYSPSVHWYRSSYWGVAALIALFLGLAGLPAAISAGSLAYMACVLTLMLGGETRLSALIWDWFPPLQYVRYPGNMSYLLMPVVAGLIAAGLSRRRWAGLFWAAISLELIFYGISAQPVAQRGFFTAPGPLVPVVRDGAGAGRYLLSPRALHWQRGKGAQWEAAVQDFKFRLYGVSNAPYRLESAGNFGEPLVPKRNYAFMDFLFSRPGIDAAAPWLGWADIRMLLTPEKRASEGLEYLGSSLWEIYKPKSTLSRARWFDRASGAQIAPGLGVLPESEGAPVDFRRPRDDRFSVSGQSPSEGWVYVAEPLGPGWSVRGAAGPLEPALGAFWKAPVLAGQWRLDFRYDPASWRIGRSLTLLFLGAFAAYWYNRLRRVKG